MAALFLISLFLLVMFDSRLLQKQDETLYDDVFDMPPQKWAFYTAFLFVILLPIHLLRRRQFKRTFAERHHSSGAVLTGKDWHASDACGIILLWFFVELFAMIALAGVTLVFPVFDSELSKLLFISVFSSSLVVALIYFVTYRYPKGFWASIGLRQEYEGRSWLHTVLIPFIFGTAFAFYAASVLMSRQIQPDTPMSDLIMTADSPLTVLALVIVAVFIAPFLEEVIFRGYFFNVLRSVKGEKIAVVAIAGTFAVLHYDQYWGDWAAIGLVTLLGLILTVLRAWSGTTVASIIAHYTYNFCIIVIPIITLIIANPSYVQYATGKDKLAYGEKEKLLVEAIRTDPAFSEAYNDLAWLYAEEGGNLQEALSLVEQALVIQPRNPSYLDTKAEILFRLGRIREAVAIEENLSEKHPRNDLYQRQLKRFKEEMHGPAVQPVPAIENIPGEQIL